MRTTAHASRAFHQYESTPTQHRRRQAERIYGQSPGRYGRGDQYQPCSDRGSPRSLQSHGRSGTDDFGGSCGEDWDDGALREGMALPQAAGGYVSFDAASDKFTLPDEQAMALAVDNSPAFIPGAYQIIASTVLDEPKLRTAFKTGDGVGWHEHNCNLFEGTERFFRPGYSAHLINE